jgi:dCMP deaminase
VTRPDWDSYFLSIAKVVAQRATCARAMVGAVIVRDNKILATGYNGSPSGEPHCLEVGCLMVNDHCERTIHAETNAVVHAGKNLIGATMYIWGMRYYTREPVEPCLKCSQVMKAAGITRIVGNKECC